MIKTDHRCYIVFADFVNNPKVEMGGFFYKIITENKKKPVRYTKKTALIAAKNLVADCSYCYAYIEHHIDISKKEKIE
jgi:hypothetical protein